MQLPCSCYTSTNGKGVKPMATESEPSRTERERAKRDLAYNAYILCSRCN
jgi:hypothetical protein